MAVARQTRTLAGLVRHQASARGSHPYLHFEGRSYTYAELDERSSQIAAALAADGVRAGDRVAVLDQNTPLVLELMFAAAKCGAVFVPLNWRLAPAALGEVLLDADPMVLVAGAEFIDAALGAVGDLRDVKLLAADQARPPFVDFEQWLGAHPASDPGVDPASTDVALQHYTSGTTGTPKGVMLSNDNLLGRLEDSAVLWGYDADSVNLVVSPLFHIGGLGTLLLGVVTGGTTVMLRVADPAKILSAVDQYAVTNALLVPAIIAMLLDTPGCEDVNWSNLRTLMYGASPISDTLLRRAMDVMSCDFIQLYGITEHSGCLTYLGPEDHDPVRRPGLLRSCGKPLPWVELQILEPGTPEPLLTAGVVGEVAVRSSQVMLGYWRQPDETQAVITEDGWFRTGDAGYLDEAGYLYLHDRTKDMIVSGGENIFPAEIENVVMMQPGIADAAVIGVPHERWGEAPHAVLVLKPGYELDEQLEQELLALCRARLGGYKCPRSLEAVAELPRNAAGKVLKRELRERAWAGHERRIG
ncbi:MAG: long-chain-fatty-acid--CoA ligase [Solirubrobacteraceae bacterium]